MLFQRKNYAFLRNLVIKLRVVKKPRCNAFYSYDDADIEITKLTVQTSLKYLIAEISEKRTYLYYCCIMQTITQSIKSNKK